MEKFDKKYARREYVNIDFEQYILLPINMKDLADLSLIELAILIQITNLDRTRNGCFASSYKIGMFLRCSKSTVDRAIKKLKMKKLIRFKMYDGRRRFLKSDVKFNCRSVDYTGGLGKILEDTNYDDDPKW